ncbi:MAG: DUF559 domain-containing protein [Actinobacteria bacterium]|nr:MAG: DUF559 domain-containing protein [Actinomycetota bacterium]
MSRARREESSTRLLAALARRQHGVFSRDQAVGAGLSSSQIWRRVQDGQLERAQPGVYRIAALRRTWHQDVMARVLWAGGGAVASHRTAAALWRFDGFDRGPAEVSVPLVRQGGRGVHRFARLSSADATIVEGIPVTTPARTVIDLAGMVSEARVEAALESALRAGLTSVGQVHRRLDGPGGRGRRGRGALRELLAQRQPGAPTDSLLETLFVQALRNAGLPEPARQHQVFAGDRLIARLDLAYPERRLFIELDGWAAHGGQEAFVADRRRQNHLVAMGWQPLRFTWDDVTSGLPAAVDVVRAALAA